MRAGLAALMEDEQPSKAARESRSDEELMTLEYRARHVTLDSLAQEPVLEVLGKVALTGLSENERRCVSDVLQVLG